MTKKNAIAAPAANHAADGAETEAPVTETYVVISRLSFGDEYEVGDEIDLAAKEAAPLLPHTVRLKS